MIIAIDGPAGSGKGTLARRLSSHYGIPHLDSGILYRAVAGAVYGAGVCAEDEAGVLSVADNFLAHLSGGDIWESCARLRDDLSLRNEDISRLSSRIAQIGCLREKLIAPQRHFASHPRGAVIEGRDIGSRICPDADFKIYLDASCAVRARRRLDEYRAQGRDMDYETVYAGILARDGADIARVSSPLVRLSDAYYIDGSDLDLEGVFLRACAYIDAKREVV